MRKQQSSGFGAKLVVLLVVIGLPALGYAIWAGLRDGPPPQIDITSDLPAIGAKTTITVKVTEPLRGLSHVKVELSNITSKVVADDVFTPQAAGRPWTRTHTAEHIVTVVIGKDTMPDLKQGELTVTVTADRASTWLRHPDPEVKTLALQVRLTPPSVAATSQFIHPTQGGVEAVVYEVGETSTHDGVQAGDWFFPGNPLPGGGKGSRFALFAIPYDMTDVSGVRLIAADDIGNRAETSFIQQFFPRPMGKDIIHLNEKFMNKVTTEIYSRTPELTKKATLVDSFLQLNGDLRRKNAAELKELAKKSEQSFLWTKVFSQMGNSQVMGHFADRRTYMAPDTAGAEKDVDTQDHLGFDLASLAFAPVPASNRGKVVLARYFGIYGNCVILDHGYGLMSLYAHLSTIDVKVDDTIEKGQTIGKTGATGMAGGDHLHFTMLLHGLAVTPVEWWDAHWIQDRLKLKLGDALPFPGGPADREAPAAPAVHKGRARR